MYIVIVVMYCNVYCNRWCKREHVEGDALKD